MTRIVCIRCKEKASRKAQKLTMALSIINFVLWRCKYAKLFFIGHRECTDSILPLVQETVERHIVEYGVTHFIIGRYGGFDSVAATAVKRAKYGILELYCFSWFHIIRQSVLLSHGLDLILPITASRGKRHHARILSSRPMSR